MATKKRTKKSVGGVKEIPPGNVVFEMEIEGLRHSNEADDGTITPWDEFTFEDCTCYNEPIRRGINKQRQHNEAMTFWLEQTGRA